MNGNATLFPWKPCGIVMDRFYGFMVVNPNNFLECYENIPIEKQKELR